VFLLIRPSRACRSLHPVTDARVDMRSATTKCMTPEDVAASEAAMAELCSMEVGMGRLNVVEDAGLAGPLIPTGVARLEGLKCP